MKRLAGVEGGAVYKRKQNISKNAVGVFNF